jgi:DNA-binding SARP family transcriptional activator/class 3 adenylate cyclase
MEPVAPAGEPAYPFAVTKVRQGRTAAVLCTDLVGSTETLARLGEIAFDDLRREHFTLLRDAIERCGGEEVKTLGDGVLAVFGAAADALDCAVRVQQAVDVGARVGAPLSVRVGLALGDVRFEEGDVFGVPVVEAARLVAVARGGQILATSLVRAVAGGRSTASFTDLGLLELKGLPGPVAACEVGWEALPATPVQPGRQAPGTTTYRILGPLEVVRGGRRIEPRSPKQRTLLIDLLVHPGETLGRDRLVDDLWGDDPPATAVGVVQNYVSQLRKALGPDAVRTTASGYAIVLNAGDELDSATFERLVEEARRSHAAGDIESVAESSHRALALWRGDPLSDVAFERFAQAEVLRLRELRAELIELYLEAEVAAGRHRAALATLEAVVTEHPLRERLWWLYMLALHRSGRQGDALRAYQRARAVLVEELGVDPGSELRELERAILKQDPALDRLLAPGATGGASSVRPSSAVARSVRPPRPPLVGRAAECATLTAFLEAGASGQGGLLLISGEPGIGKTRLLEEAQSLVEGPGGVAILGRGFEAERGRPYGAWTDALRSTDLPPLPRSLHADLSPLLPELSDAQIELDSPNRLYDAVAAVLTHLSRERVTSVLIDDLQWLDEASASLLHFAIRHLESARVCFVATARSAELEESVACLRLLQSLRRDGRLAEITLGPMEMSTLAELTRPIAPAGDVTRIAEASNGNPFFALEMARAVARGEEPLSSRLDALIGDRLQRLGEEAGRLVPWMAAFGRNTDVSILAEIVDRPVADLVAPLEDLERHGVLQVDASGTYRFTHDLVRTAAYARISTPRRTMLHGRIGAVLASHLDPDDTLAADAARHADAGRDSLTCATVCVRAARRCLRLLAYREAEEHVALGRAHARRLEPAARVSVELKLIHVLLHPGVRLHEPGDLAAELSELCAHAERLGLRSDLTLGLSLIGRVYHWAWGDIPRATALIQRVARVLDAAHEPDVEPLLEGARCLAYLNVDMERTCELFDQLAGLEELATSSHQYQWGLGLVRAWAGRLAEARQALRLAVDLATARGDHWATFECTARLALLELEAGEYAAAHPLCDQLDPRAARLGGRGSEQAYARAVAALGALTRRERDAVRDFDDAVGKLMDMDAAFLTPDLLGIAAESEYRAGDLASATAHAERALEVASTAGRPHEALRARALRACIAARDRAVDDAVADLQAIDAHQGTLPRHIAALRDEARRLAGAEDPTQGGNACGGHHGG